MKRNKTTATRILIESIESTRNVHSKLHNFREETMRTLKKRHKLCDFNVTLKAIRAPASKKILS